MARRGRWRLCWKPHDKLLVIFAKELLFTNYYLQIDVKLGIVNLLQTFREAGMNVLESGGYWFILILTIIEALPFIGTFVPGLTLIFFAGFLAEVGIFNVFLLSAVTFAGAVAGDFIGYMMGKKFGYGFIVYISRYVFVKIDQVEKARSLLHGHAGKALVIGRFYPVSRAFTPFLAGAAGVRQGTFWFFNCVGGLLWAVSAVALGYMFGASYEAAVGYIGKAAIALIVVAIILVIAFRSKPRFTLP